MEYLRKRNFIGNKRFYRDLIALTLPILVQSLLTNFVSLLDNIMVGQLSTEEMVSVAIINQLLFVVNLCIFGGLSGVGIFTAQYFGSKNMEGVKNSFRMKIWLIFGVLIVALFVIMTFKSPLIDSFLHEGSEQGDLVKAKSFAISYLHVAIFGLIPFGMQQVYASTLRESGKMMLPMVAGIIAILVNLVGNFILIFGMFGAPRLGIVGAAISTVFAKTLEAAIIIIYTHMKKHIHIFIDGVYKTLAVPKALIFEIFKKGLPLLFNELLWSSGMTVLLATYGTRGLDVLAGLNISTTITNLFNVLYLSLGSVTGIIIGQLLGANDFTGAKATVRKLIAFSVLCATGAGIFVALIGPYFPSLYKEAFPEAKQYASAFIMIVALGMPLQAFVHPAYFILRSGGRSGITFLFDCVYVWTVTVPIAYVLVNFTTIPFITVYALCIYSDIIKCTLGYIMLKKGIWMRNIIGK